MKKRDALAALLGIAAAPLCALGQSLGRPVRVGVLGVTNATNYAPQVEAMRKGFRDLGYMEGQNILIEYRWADGVQSRLSSLAAELIKLRPDVMVTSGVATRTLKEATTTIPVVMAAAGDAVASGLVASLAHPGGNITGSTFFGPEILAKRMEMLKQAVPRLGTLAVLVRPEGSYRRTSLALMNATAAALNVELVEVTVQSPKDFNDAFAQILGRRVDGLMVPDDSVFVASMRRLGELSAANRLPGAGSAEYAEGGGLLAYGADFPALWQRAPYFVDQILRGVQPGTIPVERASKFELVINSRFAKVLGVMIPQSLLLRADEVIR